jgi:hypothetical protein
MGHVGGKVIGTRAEHCRKRNWPRRSPEKTLVTTTPPRTGGYPDPDIAAVLKTVM